MPSLEDSSSPSAFPRRWSGPQPRPELPDFAEKDGTEGLGWVVVGFGSRRAKMGSAELS